MMVNGWTFDPTDETWFARVSGTQWIIVPGALGNPPAFTPEDAKRGSE